MTNNNPYQQPPQTPVQPPTRRRVRTNVLVPNAIFPDWLSKYAVITYVLALVAVSFLYSNYMLPWYYMLSGVVSIVAFFIYGSNVTKRTSVMQMRSQKSFEKRIFLVAFIPRLLFMLLLYYLFMTHYGNVFGFETADAPFYDILGQDFATSIRNGEFVEMWRNTNKSTDISDMGYGVYVGVIYWLTGSNGVLNENGYGGEQGSILAVRLLKCIWSALTVFLIYRLAKRNFGEQTGRIAAIFCALWPNFWYYCGVHLKETEMVFLAVLFVEQADQMLRSRQFTAWKVLPVLLVGAAMFTFRTPLALVAILALLFSVVMSSNRVVNWGKRIIVGGLAIILIGVTMGNRIHENADELLKRVQMNEQKSNMEWRGRRTDGNSFAKYASSAVFAPLIFSIPFPSFVRPFDGQDHLQILNGGNFVKNIISFFTIFAMVMLLLSGKWRDHLLPLAFLLGYLVVLTMSTFAQSERFHQPIIPFEFMFAAYGMSIAVTKLKYKRWFTYWCGLMFIAAIAWNWFKLAGRGLV